MMQESWSTLSHLHLQIVDKTYNALEHMVLFKVIQSKDDNETLFTNARLSCIWKICHNIKWGLSVYAFFLYLPSPTSF